MLTQADAERRHRKQQQQDLRSLQALQAEVAAEEAQQQHRQRRRATILAERLAAGPGRLGKLKYSSAPIQVRWTKASCSALYVEAAAQLAGGWVQAAHCQACSPVHTQLPANLHARVLRRLCKAAVCVADAVSFQDEQAMHDVDSIVG